MKYRIYLLMNKLGIRTFKMVFYGHEGGWPIYRMEMYWYAKLIFTGKTYSTSNAEITITDAVNGKFRFNKQIITLPVGRNKYKMRFTFSDGTVKIYMEGQWRIQ